MAKDRKKGVCELSEVVAFYHNKLWRPRAAKVITKLAKISPNGNTAGGTYSCVMMPLPWLPLKLLGAAATAGTCSDLPPGITTL